MSDLVALPYLQATIAEVSFCPFWCWIRISYMSDPFFHRCRSLYFLFFCYFSNSKVQRITCVAPLSLPHVTTSATSVGRFCRAVDAYIVGFVLDGFFSLRNVTFFYFDGWLWPILACQRCFQLVVQANHVCWTGKKVSFGPVTIGLVPENYL